MPRTAWQVCDSTHGVATAHGLDSFFMEWMLQVADEIDDAVWAVRHGCVGLFARFDVPLGALLAAAASATGDALRRSKVPAER